MMKSFLSPLCIFFAILLECLKLNFKFLLANFKLENEICLEWPLKAVVNEDVIREEPFELFNNNKLN